MYGTVPDLPGHRSRALDSVDLPPRRRLVNKLKPPCLQIDTKVLLQRFGFGTG